MSLTNPPSNIPGPASASGTRRRNIKRSFSAAFEDSLDGLTPKGPTGFHSKNKVANRYKVTGFISSGTYGRVYKALGQTEHNHHDVFAIKKFKPDKEGERLAYTEHDLLQIIHHHTQPPRQPLQSAMIKSIMFQLINGCKYLHANWVLHRDLKPANIMVTSSGVVKIADFGLARRFSKPLQPLFSGDKVVVTIWYRAPELLLGSWHYDPAIDMWAVGCIFAELLSLRPLFKGDEVRIDAKKVPFQRNQMQKIVDVLGVPTKDQWPLVTSLPEYGQLLSLQLPTPHIQNQKTQSLGSKHGSNGLDGTGLPKWYYGIIQPNASRATSCLLPSDPETLAVLGSEGYKLLASLLEYDPQRRLTAGQALDLEIFHVGSKVSMNCFDGLEMEYPHRRLSQDDNDTLMGISRPSTKRG